MEQIFPKISVLMPVYNGERYLTQAVESILDQTFEDLEFIIIDDGSTDATALILDNFTDPRIVRIKNETNIGLSASLNRGINAARGEYIARMDADDVSLPDRLERQVTYLAHSQAAMLGTGYLKVNQDGKLSPGDKVLQTDIALKWHAQLQNPFVHSTVMYSAEQARKLGGYSTSPESLYVEDYELWLRLIEANCQLALLPDVLVHWRDNPQGVSATHMQVQSRNFRALVEKNISSLLPDHCQDKEQIYLLWSLQVGAGMNTSIGTIRQALVQLDEMVDKFSEHFKLDGITRQCIRKIAFSRVANTILQNAAQYSYINRMTDSREMVALALELDSRLRLDPIIWRILIKTILGGSKTEKYRQFKRWIKGR